MSPLLLHSNTNQYDVNGLLCNLHRSRCFAYRHAATTFYQLQRGFGGRRQHARIQEFLSVLFNPQLILQFTEGSNGFIAVKTILILYQGSRGGPLFSRGVSNFFQGGGPNANFYRNPYTYLLFSRGWCLDPYPPLDPHMCNVIIMGQYLSQSRF